MVENGLEGWRLMQCVDCPCLMALQWVLGRCLHRKEPEGPVYVTCLCSHGRRVFGCVCVQIDRETAGARKPICHSCLFLCPGHSKQKIRASLGLKGEQNEVVLSQVRRCFVGLLWGFVMDSTDTPQGVPSTVGLHSG